MLMVAMGLALSGCKKDAPLPVKPTNEILNKLHEDPFKMVITLEEAHLSTVEQFDQAPKVTDLKYSGKKQILQYSSGGGHQFKIEATSPNQRLEVKTIKEDATLVYLMRIEYFNNKGESMNNQFYDNGQDKIHQHFFSSYTNAGATNIIIKDKSRLTYDYRYADTKPFSDDKGEYIGQSNPLGFKGIFRFLKAATPDLRIELLHAVQSKYSKDGSITPFFLVSNVRQGNLFDINVPVPITITD